MYISQNAEMLIKLPKPRAKKINFHGRQELILSAKTTENTTAFDPHSILALEFSPVIVQIDFHSP